MPLSKNRRKNGKKVIRGKKNRREARAAELSQLGMPSLTLQDLINVVAYQENQKSDDDPTKMHNPNLEKESEDGR